MAAAWDDGIWRIGAAQALAVASVGGAAASTTVFGTETYAIMVSYPGSTSSTSGARVLIFDTGGSPTAVSSTAGTLLPPAWVQLYKVTPGQKLSAISNDAGTFSMSVTELTK